MKMIPTHGFLGFAHFLFNLTETLWTNYMHIFSFKSFVKTQNTVELVKRIAHWIWLLIVKM